MNNNAMFGSRKTYATDRLSGQLNHNQVIYAVRLLTLISQNFHSFSQYTSKFTLNKPFLAPIALLVAQLLIWVTLGLSRR